MSALDELIDSVDLGEPDAAEALNESAEAEEQPEGEAVETTPEEPTEQAKPPAGEPEAPKKTDDTVPLAVHMDLKHRLRDAAQRLAALEADRMMPAAQAPAGEPQKSPLDKFAEDEGEDAVPTTQVLIEQRKWDQAQTQTQAAGAAQATAKRSVQIAVRSMTDETMGDGLGFDTVLQMGHAFLTEGDVVDVRGAGGKAGQVLYQRCLERAVRSGTPEGKLLAQAVKAARTGRTVTTPPKKAGAKKAEAPTREQVLTATTAPAMGADGQLADFFLGE